MTFDEKLRIAQETISALEHELLKKDDYVKKLVLDKDKAELKNLQLYARIEVYQDVVDSLIKEVRGDR